MNRRQLIKTIAAMAGISACARFGSGPMTIAAHTWVGYEPMFMARNEGWLEEQTARLYQTQNAMESLQALAEGKVHGAALTLDEVLQARQRGQKLTAVMIFNISAGADMLVARPQLASLSDLRGKRLAYEQSSVGALLLAEILNKAGLARSDLTLLPLGVDKQVAAWREKAFDAAITYEPVASELLDLGARKLFDSRQIPNTIVDVLVIRSDLVSEYDEALRHLQRAHFRALDHLARNPHDAAYRMAGHLGLPAGDVLSAFKGLVLPDAPANQRLLAGKEPPLLLTAKRLSAVMLAGGLLQQPDTLHELVNADFIPGDLLEQ